ncbi:NUDIX hydrolase [Dyella mobilis]|uniref:NUDIX domain-containing protein n=1 Tax=Dyella mobilis TaxID=1849582 RepID=A0ABS2KHZ2_9GAMM|nr:NUDIX domain-containing protein [Dyella mobilis]MBM7130543.1 NUDIX domain-containing protein [Dyella mobilis]
MIRDEAGRILLVRKRGAAVFQQPGGKRDVGDRDDLQTLARELHEELGCTMRRESARLLGRFSAPAANEPGWVVEAVVYEVQASGPFQASAEIEALHWIDPARPGDLPIARLSREQLLPLMVSPTGS